MTFPLVAAVVTGLVAAWRLAVLVRSTKPTLGRVVAALLFSAQFVSNVVSLPAVSTALDGVAVGLASLVANLAIFAFYVGFVVFFGGAVGAGPLTRARVQVPVAASFALTMIVMWAVNLRTGRPLSAGGPHSTISFVYFLAGNLYFGYALALSVVLAVRAARRAASRRGRIAFSVCALGLLMAFVGGPLTRTPSVLGRSFGQAWVPAGWATVARGVLNIGIAVIVIGLCVLALSTTADGFRRWSAAKRGTRTLAPLRGGLHAAFPHIALHRPRSPVFELLRVRRVAFHYRRHLVECRDGLWCLSRFIPEPDTAAVRPVPDQARAVADALERVADGAEPAADPTAVAAPPEGGDDELRVLALARAFADHSRDHARSGAPGRASSMRHTARR